MSEYYDPSCEYEREERSCGCEAHRPCEKTQRHVHEFTGSVTIAREKCEKPHNHRFACVSGQAIPTCNGHVHKLEARTDFYDDHYHLICDTTGPAIYVGCGRHVHLVKGCTSKEDGHVHKYLFATLIENPIGD